MKSTTRSRRDSDSGRRTAVPVSKLTPFSTKGVRGGGRLYRRVSLMLCFGSLVTVTVVATSPPARLKYVTSYFCPTGTSTSAYPAASVSSVQYLVVVGAARQMTTPFIGPFS